MKEVDYTFENTIVTCDKCGIDVEIDEMDYSSINEELREMGWVVTKENGDWVDYCVNCANK